MKTCFAIVACVAGFACAQPRIGETGLPSARYHEIDAIVVAPLTGLSPVVTGEYPIVPRFPGEPGRRREGAEAVVAFVVDTLGAIERGSVSFLSSTIPVYRAAVCEWSRGARFEPLVVEGRRRRGLTVSSFSFYISKTPFPEFESPSPVEKFQATLREMSSAELYPMLEKRPHC